MKIFERDYKINFVDDNNVFVGFDNDQNCCEDFGWKITKEFPADCFKESEEEINLDGFQFDVAYFKKVIESDTLDTIEAVVFRLTNGNEEIFLTLWNHHNGYYSHGFEMKAGDECIFSGDL
jgi:hypothetical protein